MNNNWEYVPFSTLFDWCQKSNIGSRQGDRIGKYPLYIASATEIKRFDEFLENGESLVFGTGGNPCIHYATGKFAYTNHTEVAKKSLGSINTKFYYYFFQKDRFSLLKSTFVGGGIKNSSKKKIGLLPVPLVCTEEQERIVARIEELFSQLVAGVETLKKTKAQLATYRQAVVEDAIFTAKKHGTVAKQFGEYVLQYQNGFSKRSGKGISTPVLRLADIDRQKITIDKGLRYIGLSDNERSRFLLNEGDLLIIRVNGSENNVGRSIIVNSGGIYAACDHFIRCIIDGSRITSEYAQLLLDSFSSRKHIKENMVSSAGQNTVSQTTMNTVTVYVPEIDVQREIMKTAKERLSVCDNIEQTVDTALQQAEAMRQSILKDAFEGRL